MTACPVCSVNGPSWRKLVTTGSEKEEQDQCPLGNHQKDLHLLTAGFAGQENSVSKETRRTFVPFFKVCSKSFWGSLVMGYCYWWSLFVYERKPDDYFQIVKRKVTPIIHKLFQQTENEGNVPNLFHVSVYKYLNASVRQYWKRKKI